MPVPSADGSAQPAPAVAAATKPRPDEAGHSAESMVPRVVLESVRLILGDVDLDPCSSEAAQVGLSRPWGGNVFVYPPAGRVDAFAQKLTAEMARDNVQRAAFLGPADLRPGWAVRLLQATAFRALVIERDDRECRGGRRPNAWRRAAGAVSAGGRERPFARPARDLGRDGVLGAARCEPRRRGERCTHPDRGSRPASRQFQDVDREAFGAGSVEERQQGAWSHGHCGCQAGL